MKKLFSKKSGFTLVEIIVAFAIFTIMMTMIMQILQLSISQRRANMEFADKIEAEQNALVANGKDTAKAPDDVDRDTMPEVNLAFVNSKAPDADPLEIGIKYQLKGTNEDNERDGLNYFVGDFDYDADGTGGDGGDGDSNGAGQTAQYDTRLTGTKGLKDIKVTVDTVSSLPDGTPIKAGQTAYKMTVNANSGSMQADDKKYSQMRFYFYSSTAFDIKKVEKQKLKADGKPMVDGSGKPVMETYYKKVYKKADLAQVIPATGNAYVVEQSSDYALRIGLPLDGSNNNAGFEPGKTTTFYLIFNGDPGLTAGSFGSSSGTYNRSPIYDEKTGTQKTGKSHVNIYGSFPFETSKDKDGEFKVGGAS